MADKENKTKSKTVEEYDKETLTMLGLNTDASTEKSPKKPVFYFERIGLVIPVWAMLTLEKSMKFEEKPKMHAVYGIVINKGMELSQNCPIGEKALWYEKEEIRDQHFERIIEEMKKSTFKVTQL